MNEAAVIFEIGSMTTASDRRINLVGMTRDEIASALADLNVERYRADQIYSWVYTKGVRDFEEMTNISKELRSPLAEIFCILQKFLRP